MKFVLVLVVILAGGKPRDAFVSGTFNSSAECEQVGKLNRVIADRLVGTRKTDGTEVIGVSTVCVASTAADTDATIKARAIGKRR